MYAAELATIRKPDIKALGQLTESGVFMGFPFVAWKCGREWTWVSGQDEDG
jgi:hypothetical protein